MRVLNLGPTCGRATRGSVGPGKREEADFDVPYAMRSSGARARYATCGEIECAGAGRLAVPPLSPRAGTSAGRVLLK
eukprot:SAG31_NODE_2959_length_4851_cov_5.415825_2_plen_77_part_00